MIRPFTSMLLTGLLAGLSSVAIIATAPPAWGQETEHAFDIPAQSLSSALLEFSRQSGVPLLVSPDLVAGKRAPQVKGTLTPSAVLDRLLRGTGLEPHRQTDGGITLTAAAQKSSNNGVASRSRRNTELADAAVADPASGSDESSRTGRSDASKRSANDQDMRLEEVIVTAQRRTENLQNVPVSVQAIRGQTLAEQNQFNLQELTESIPGVHIDPINMYIRGIGSGNNEAFDQSVGTFVDDIYHGRSRAGAAAFLDLDRIEILKGPQSTFFGSNAIAGAVNIVTKKPSDQFDASARALYGMFGQYAAEGAVSGPISNTLDARLAVLVNGLNDGWIDNVALGKTYPKEHNLAARLTFAFRPSDDLDATFKLEGSENRVYGAGLGGQPDQFFNCTQQSPVFENWFGGECAQARTQHLPIGLDNNKNSGLAGQKATLKTAESVLTVNYRKWDQVFSSVTGFTGFDSQELGATNFPDPTGSGTQTAVIPLKYHQFSQELRVTSPTDQPIEYLAGAYFQTDHSAYELEVNLPKLNFLATIPPFTALAPYLPPALDNQFSQDEQSYAVFGSLSWNATDRLKLTGGLRGVVNHKSFYGTSSCGTGTSLYGGFAPTPPGAAMLLCSLFGGVTWYTPGSFSRTDRAWMPSAKIQYQIAPTAMAYASYARGFLAGGFNGTDGTHIPSNIPYNPEFVNAYEVGIKSQALNDTVLLNFDVFRADYTDLQAAVFVPGTPDANGVLVGGYTAVRNAAASRSQGVEFEGQWVASRSFRLSANVTYLDSYYASYRNGPATLEQGIPTFAGGQGLAFQDLSGKPTLYAPRWSGSLTGNYRVILPRAYTFSAELTSFYTKGYFLQGDASDDPALVQGGYTRLDGRLTFQSPDARWAVELIGKNLTDRVIITGFGGPTDAVKERLRNVAVQFRYRFQ